MPRVYPPKRTAVSIRLSPEGLAEVDKLAAVIGRTRSKTIRLLLSEAFTARAQRSRLGTRQGVKRL